MSDDHLKRSDPDTDHLLEAQALAHLGSWSLDHSTGSLNWSPYLRELLRLGPRERPNARHLLLRVHREDRGKFREAYHAVRSGKAHDLTIRLVLPGGHVRHMNSRSRMIAGTRDRAGRSVGIVQDVTELYAAEEELIALSQNLEDAATRSTSGLLEERNFTDAVLEGLGTPVVVMDRAGRIVRVNRAAEELTGLLASELAQPQFWRRALPPDEQRDARRLFVELLRSGRTAQLEAHCIRKGGERRLISWTTTASRASDGRIQHAIFCGIDVTEARRNQQALEEAKR